MDFFMAIHIAILVILAIIYFIKYLKIVCKEHTKISDNNIAKAKEFSNISIGFFAIAAIEVAISFIIFN